MRCPPSCPYSARPDPRSRLVPGQRARHQRLRALRPEHAPDPLPLVRRARRDRVPLRRRGAHRAPRAAGRAVRRRSGPTTCSCAATPRACISSAGATCTAAGAGSMLARDTVSDRILEVYTMGEPRPRIERLPRRPGAAPGAISRSSAPAPTRRRELGDRHAQQHRLRGGGPDRSAAAARVSPSTAPATKATPATRSLRRCSRTASIWSGAASSITARAASSAPAPRSRTRSCSWAAARAPSPTSAPPRSSCTTAWPPQARTAGHPSGSTCGALQWRPRPAVPGGLLLQDLHVAAELVAARVRAADPPRRRPGPGADRARSRSLRAHARALRRARGRRRSRRADGGARRRPERRARASWSTSSPSSAARC